MPDRKNLPVANADSDFIEYVAQEMASTVGYAEENAARYHKLARHCRHDLIYRVLAESKAEKPAQLEPGLPKSALDKGYVTIGYLTYFL